MQDRKWMKLAVEQARLSPGEGREKPPPKVGAVVVKDGELLAAAHRSEGEVGRHAEYVALEEKLKEASIAGATVYTTLEPCTDRNDPKRACVDRLIERKVKRVVFGMVDPDPKIRGNGIRKLRDANIEVDVFDPDLMDEIEELNADFRRRFAAPPPPKTTAAPPPAQPPAAAAAQIGPKDREAMRAFLQRGEVRLSTMHRIAGVFLNGAGLLLLFPLFLRESLRDLMSRLHAAASTASGLQTASLAALYLAAFASLLIITYSIFLLFKDIVQFYFVGHSPGFSGSEFYPRFALTALAFPPDESPTVKEQVFERQRTNDLMYFLLPQSQERLEGKQEVWKAMGDEILPSTRRAFATDELHRAFNVVLGQSGLLDRELVDEVAKLETSLARHNVLLRRLVLRYAKALVLLIWTMIITWLIVLLPVPPDSSWIFGVLAAGYFFWALATPFLIRWPIAWIYENSSQNASRKKNVGRDAELVHFERAVGWFAGFAGAMVVISAVLRFLG
ncbi:MAG TPA: bifunctional diaminohydroxyphosphoribosylaminopyrimidine deaminase/5-amino-6-(5-phosphoribosylamino)uracil reductase RibD [Thermoanaerobaculia bacterium]|nr:bifunctional diaminohydroxyphosphoribosylaminopyrimidine deaminase/5-amino-6-(5-phosphoribosylamino)uracil reductase RibD [Thermoanaerobaculia bacterium]